jgi:hypothetical protein
MILHKDIKYYIKNLKKKIEGYFNLLFLYIIINTKMSVSDYNQALEEANQIINQLEAEIKRLQAKVNELEAKKPTNQLSDFQRDEYVGLFDSFIGSSGLKLKEFMEASIDDINGLFKDLNVPKAIQIKLKYFLKMECEMQRR